MGFATALFALAATAIVAAWGWLGAPAKLPQSPLAPGEKLHCISYAPFRASQSPLGPDTPIDPRQIEEDLAQLKQIANCVRTYSTDHGLDRIPEIARRHGLKVMQGLWLSSLPDLTRKQIDSGIALARRFPDVIETVIVGNEVLLRGEMSAPDLARTIREVKAQVPMRVTYADVWEFWLRHREVAAAADFVTVHILPYWEDFPIPARDAAAHVAAIRQKVVAAFPDREVFVGEFGWPSAGRMREGALPSPVNQARALTEVLAVAKRGGFRVNLIEAYDQPWKRRLEGTVGGHWGLYGAHGREPKFAWGGAVSNHPQWIWQAAGGVGLALAMFAAAWWRWGAGAARGLWLRLAGMAAVSGTVVGWTAVNVPVESLTAGDWARSLAWLACTILGPILGAMAAVTGTKLALFAQILGRRAERPADPLALALGAVLVVLTVLAVAAALGLVFDPRYRDFPFAPLTGAVAPFALLTGWELRLRARRPAAETAAAATLVLSALYIAGNEGFANWQALWFCAGLVALALILLQARDAPG